MTIANEMYRDTFVIITLEFAVITFELNTVISVALESAVDACASNAMKRNVSPNHNDNREDIHLEKFMYKHSSHVLCGNRHSQILGDTVQTFNSCTYRPVVSQCLVVQRTMYYMSKNRPSPSMANVACELKLRSFLTSAMHLWPGNVVATGRAVVYYATYSVQELNVGIVDHGYLIAV